MSKGQETTGKRIDMHVHTAYSKSLDAPLNTVEDIYEKYKKGAIEGIAVCEHNTLCSFDIIKKFMSKKAPEFVLVRGLEVSTSEGHIIGYGINEEIPRGLGAQETIDMINEQGAVPVVPHPLSPFSGVTSKFDSLKRYKGIETLNGVSFDIIDYLTYLKTKDIKCAKLGGSDSHMSWTIGTTYTEFPESTTNEDAVLRCIRKSIGTPKRKHYRSLLNFIIDWGGFRFFSAPQRLRNIIHTRSFRV
jgi:predicted metal-dependent phosphoesterase TrpH